MSDPRCKRRYRRRTVRVLVDFTHAGTVRCEYATTLGAGGMFVETEQPVPAGEPVKLRFRLPHADEVHELEARVAWSQPPSGPGDVTARSPGMGLEFKDPVGSAALARALERMDDGNG